MIDNGPYTEMKPENGFENVVVKEEKHKPEYDKYMHALEEVQVEAEQPAPTQESQPTEMNEYGSVQEQTE